MNARFTMGRRSTARPASDDMIPRTPNSPEADEEWVRRRKAASVIQVPQARIKALREVDTL